tara:strand:- start:1065 stop:1526 length:462 start_codon:yes stop_codon:yes gene_type:complete
MKKIAYLIIFFIVVGCGYEPIYSKKGSYNISVKNYILEGNKGINRKLVSLLNLKENKNQQRSTYNLTLISKSITEVTAKDGLGNTSIYKTTISISFDLKNLGNEGKTFKPKDFIASFSYNNMTNKFDLTQYQKTIETNLITRISEEIAIFINS